MQLARVQFLFEEEKLFVQALVAWTGPLDSEQGAQRILDCMMLYGLAGDGHGLCGLTLTVLRRLLRRMRIANDFDERTCHQTARNHLVQMRK